MNKIKCKKLLTVICLVGLLSTLGCFSLKAHADFLLTAEGTSVQGSLATPTSTSQSQTYLEGGVMWGFGSRTPLYFGLLYSSYGSNDKDFSDVTRVFLSQDFSLGTKFYFGRDKQFSVMAAYGFLSTANYKEGSSAVETWSGTSSLFKISYQSFVTQRFALGASLVYYNATYIKKDVAAVSTSFSGGKSFLLPVLGLNFMF